MSIKVRFVRNGGWERSFDVDDRLPRVWNVALPFRASPRFDDDSARKTQRLESLVFHLEQFRSEEEPEFIYVEECFSTSEVEPHECAALHSARRRIRDFEHLCLEAYCFLSEERSSLAMGLALDGARRRQIEELEGITSKLAYVIRNLPEETIRAIRR